jgi:hypothetical protein
MEGRGIDSTDSKRGKAMRVLYTENEALVRVCYEWQTNCSKIDS